MKYAHRQQASLQRVSKNDFHVPQQNLLLRKNNPALDMEIPY